MLLGYQAGKTITTSDRNVAIGYEALKDLSNTGAQKNIVIGWKAGLGGSGDMSDNIAIGDNAMDGTGTLDALANIFIGRDAGGGTWTTAASSYNVGIGNYVMDAAMNGAINNVGIGHNALSAVTEGDRTVAIGHGAGS